MKLLKDDEFLPWAFKLDHQHPLPMTPDIVDIISLKYERFSLQAKTIFYIE